VKSKFHLSVSEQKAIMAEALPFCETAANPTANPALPSCRIGTPNNSAHGTERTPPNLTILTLAQPIGLVG
jgi:hypothetical protein